jgi:Transglutaminase-like superfamily/Coenzyme PQQ synthesis protein D (PqqD)
MIMIQAILSSERPGPGTEAGEYVLAPDVLLLLIQDGTARLLDMDGCFYALSASGATMLQETLQHDTMTAAQRIATHYGVPAQHVQGDIEPFLSALERRHLIHHREARRTYKTTSTLPFLALAAARRVMHGNGGSLRSKAWILLTVARLSFDLFGWAHTIAAWQRYFRQVAHQASVQGREDTIRAIDEAVRAVAAEHVFAMGCKERSLCCWALLRSVGVPAAVVLGINLFPLASHCWCESGPWMLSDYQDQCEKFTPVARYE